MEVGRVNNTLYLLNYIDDEDYRRRILTQLNRERRPPCCSPGHLLWSAWGDQKRYREGLGDQLDALGLVTNAVVLWNTLCMQEALSWMRSHGEETGDEDIARLSPLMHGYISMQGHYTFTLSDDIQKGELWSLNFNLNNVLSSERMFSFHWPSNPKVLLVTRGNHPVSSLPIFRSERSKTQA